MLLIDIFGRIEIRNTILLFLVTVSVSFTAKNGGLNLWIDEQQVKMFSGECATMFFQYQPMVLIFMSRKPITATERRVVSIWRDV